MVLPVLAFLNREVWGCPFLLHCLFPCSVSVGWQPCHLWRIPAACEQVWSFMEEAQGSVCANTVRVIINFAWTTAHTLMTTSSTCKAWAGNSRKEPYVLAGPGRSSGLEHSQALLLGFPASDAEVGDCNEVILIGAGLLHIQEKGWLPPLASWLVLAIQFTTSFSSLLSQVKCSMCKYDG